jgi:hypothetical protein
MALVKIKSRAVSALKIIGLEPLYVRGEMKSISAGALLRLSDGTSRTWLQEFGGATTPELSDIFIEDAELGTSAVVGPAKFSQLFNSEESKA